MSLVGVYKQYQNASIQFIGCSCSPAGAGYVVTATLELRDSGVLVDSYEVRLPVQDELQASAVRALFEQQYSQLPDYENLQVQP